MTKKTQRQNPDSPKAIGIGGIFFYSKHPEQTRQWYAKNLGIELNAWGGASFNSSEEEEAGENHSIEWKPFPDGDSYFQPSEKPFMINYRVQHIEALLVQLRANGVQILDEIKHYEGIGKFLHIMDEEGNKLELWEAE